MPPYLARCFSAPLFYARTIQLTRANMVLAVAHTSAVFSAVFHRLATFLPCQNCCAPDRNGFSSDFCSFWESCPDIYFRTKKAKPRSIITSRFCFKRTEVTFLSVPGIPEGISRRTSLVQEAVLQRLSILGTPFRHWFCCSDFYACGRYVSCMRYGI